MSTLKELIPDVEVLLALEPEELAGALLRVVPSQIHNRNFHFGNFVGSLFGVANVQYPRENQEAVTLALVEANAWLEANCLLVPAPGQWNGWMMLSRRAKRILAEDSFETFRQASRLPKELLHPRIAETVWVLFIRGDLDTAVFRAFKEVEVAVREAGNYMDSDIGVALMRKAFDVESGRLTDKARERGERQAASDLFAGAIGSYKNPHSHRTVAINDPTEAAEMILLASHLLRIVDARRPPPAE